MSIVKSLLFVLESKCIFIVQGDQLNMAGVSSSFQNFTCPVYATV